MLSSLNYVLGRLEGLATSSEAKVQNGILDTCVFISDLIDTHEAEESEDEGNA